jgi:lipoate-protein ligase B
MAVCRWWDAGRLSYAEGLALQKKVVARRVAKEIPDSLIFVEHAPVITMGKMSKPEHVIGTRAGVDVVATPGAATSRTTARGRSWAIRSWT